MKVIINKPKVPIIWLDTFVILWLKKLKYHEIIDDKNPSNERDIRIKLENLYNVIYKKVRERKLICPQGEQDSEIELKSDKDHLEKCLKIQNKLSLGIKFVPGSWIKKNQMEHMMKSYIKGEKCVNINYKNAFPRGTINELENKKYSTVSVNIIPSKNLISKRKHSKNLTNEQLEEIRQKTVSAGFTFEQQLSIEYEGIIKTLLIELPKIMSRIYSDHAIPGDFDKLNVISEPYELWENFHKKSEENKPKLLNELVKFFKSEYYKSIPYVYIFCNLMSEVITRKSAIKSGDCMDIVHLSAVIPYCKYVITDRKMKAAIKRRKIDTKYKANIYCKKDFDQLFKILEKL